MNRRDWVKKTGIISAGAILSAQVSSAAETKKKPRILLVSGWQTVNIGDIAHTPGMIHLLSTYMPEAKITLWPNDISLTEEAMLRRNFPSLEIVFGRLNEQGLPDSSEVEKAFNDNERFAEKDHEKLRQVIVKWVTETGNKVVVVPEMQCQTELFEPLLYNPLPENIKRKVEMHPYWQPDAAASLYSKAAAVISMECHSPIISLVNGTPAIYVRQPSDTIKGQMYYDLKLDDWIFEIDNTTGEQIAERVMEIYRSYPESLEKVKQLSWRVKIIYDQRMKEFCKTLLKNK